MTENYILWRGSYGQPGFVSMNLHSIEEWRHQERSDLRVQWKQINSKLNLAIRRWDVEKMAKKREDEKRREEN